MKRNICAGCFLVLALMAIAALGTKTCYTYWPQGSLSASVIQPISIRVGTFKMPWDGPNVPDNTPEEVVKIIEDMDPEVQDVVSKVVTEVVEDPCFTGDIFLGETIADLFDEGKTITARSGDVIIYTTIDESGNFTSIAVVIQGAATQTFNNMAELLRKLNNEPWSGVNYISPLWLSTNSYTPYTMPVGYKGELYLPFTGATGSLPSNGSTWFKLHSDLSFDPNNTYAAQGFIVKYNELFYISKQWIAGRPALPSSSDAWALIPQWEQNAYAASNLVWTDDGGTPRFWRALKATSAEPSEAEARNGVWQEISNGWIAAKVMSDFYLDHNTYAGGTIVIYGACAALYNHYYNAIRAVPAGEPPLIEVNGELVLNTAFWAEDNKHS